MDRLFDRFARGFGLPSLRSIADFEPPWRSFMFSAPPIDMSEDDKAYKVSAELPAEATQTYADKRQQGHERQRSCRSELTCNGCRSTGEKGDCAGDAPPEHLRFDRLETENQERPCRQDREDH